MNLAQLIDRLNELKAKHGDIKIGSGLDLQVIGISHKHLLIFSELPLVRTAVYEKD